MNITSSLDELNSQYQTLISLPEKAFFVGVANYVRFVLNSLALQDLHTELSQKVLIDYDKTLETIKNRKPKQSDHKKWQLADFIEAGRALGEQHKLIKDSNQKKEIEASHAWARLQSLEIMIHDRARAQKIYSKTPRGTFEYKVSIKELDMILCAKEDEQNNEEYEFWVESGLKDSLSSVPRSTFIRDEYLNYLAQVHTFFTTMLSTKGNSKTQFPSSENVTYQNKNLNFMLGDGSYISVDFSTSPDLRKVFESFWELRRRNFQEGSSLEAVLNVYKQLFNEVIDSHILVTRISHIRRTKINTKPELKDRFKIEYVKSDKTWHLILK